MNKATGSIISISSAGAARHAQVRIDAAPVCQRCAEGRGCGAGLFGSGQRSRLIEVQLPPGSTLDAGDTVTLSLEPRRLLAAASLVYGLPLLGAAAGSLLALLLAASDAIAVIAALGGLAAGIVLARMRLADGDCSAEFAPRIIA